MAPPQFSLLDRLAGLPYFRTMKPDRLALLAGCAVARHYPAGMMIFGQDEPSAGLWIVERGRVKVSRLSPDGREHILLFVGPGESFNEIAMLDGHANPATATALEDVTAWTLASALLLEALRADPELALDVITSLCGRVRQLVQQIEDLALCSVTSRLARFLLKQIEDPVLSGPVVTRALIASHLATTPESISRGLRALEQIGAIRFDRQNIVILRQDLLDSVAME